MKYIKLFEYYQDIETICDQYDIVDYTIDDNGLLNVDNVVNLESNNLEKLPLKFSMVEGDFLCGNNDLKTLEGSPKVVSGCYLIHGNINLESLKYSPESVGTYFDANICSINSLEYMPKYIGRSFEISNNDLVTVKHIQNSSINGKIILNNNQIKSTKYLDKFVNNTIEINGNYLPHEIVSNIKYLKDIIKLQSEFQIWNYNDSFNVERFKLLMEEIKQK